MVWRSRGIRRTMAATCGSKPMSSIRSASSRIRISTPSRRTRPRSARSSRRPGVATRTSALVTPRDCSRMVMPPYAAATWRPLAAAMSWNSRTTCAASSRVGTRTRARGRRRAPGTSRSTMGMAKARVLPEPVRLRARTSRPAMASGSTSAWIGKAYEMPRPASASDTGADTPNSAKVWVVMLFLSVVPCGPPNDRARLFLRRTVRSGGTAEVEPHGAAGVPLLTTRVPDGTVKPPDEHRMIARGVWTVGHGCGRLLHALGRTPAGGF